MENPAFIDDVPRDKKNVVFVEIFQSRLITKGSGWWHTYLSEKYESQLGLLFPIYIYIIIYMYRQIKAMFQTINQGYICQETCSSCGLCRSRSSEAWSLEKKDVEIPALRRHQTWTSPKQREHLGKYGQNPWSKCRIMHFHSWENAK